MQQATQNLITPCQNPKKRMENLLPWASTLGQQVLQLLRFISLFPCYSIFQVQEKTQYTNVLTTHEPAFYLFIFLIFCTIFFFPNGENVCVFWGFLVTHVLQIARFCIKFQYVNQEYKRMLNFFLLSLGFFKNIQIRLKQLMDDLLTLQLHRKTLKLEGIF